MYNKRLETRNNALVMSPWRQSIWVSHEIGIIILPTPCLVSNQLQGPRPGQKQYRITGTPGSLGMNELVPGSKLLRGVLERSLEWEGLACGRGFTWWGHMWQGLHYPGVTSQLPLTHWATKTGGLTKQALLLHRHHGSREVVMKEKQTSISFVPPLTNAKSSARCRV